LKRAGDDEQKRARLEHALGRVRSEERTQELCDALTGKLNGRRTNYN
jgi:hypothetical protein